jgi:tetratricopeptide (TPR) repeat protein
MAEADLCSPDEEYALARFVLDPWLARLAQSGTPDQRIRGFASLIQINGLEAFQRLDWLVGVDKSTRDIYRYSAVRSVIAHHEHISWNEVRAMIESGGDEYQKAAELVLAADEMDRDEMGDGAIDGGEHAMRLEWLNEAVLHGRKIGDPTQRVRLLASAARCLFRLGDVARARQILAEAENEANALTPDIAAQYAYVLVALAAAYDDADRTLDWLVKAQGYLKMHGGRVASALLPDHPQQAVEVWKRVAEALRTSPGRTSDGTEYRRVSEFCYRLALIDRPLAEQVAANADEPIMRFREKGAIILALAETQPAEASRLLAALVRDDLPQLPIEESRLMPRQSAPAIAAWLLPVAERVDPGLSGELFWRSLALRLPRPRRNELDSQAEWTDAELAKLLARYDREIARVLLEPLAVKALTSGQVASSTFLATVHVDPRWAKSLLDTLADSPSMIEVADNLRFQFVWTLAMPLPDRWNGLHFYSGDFSAGYWEPSARDRPLPP